MWFLGGYTILENQKGLLRFSERSLNKIRLWLVLQAVVLIILKATYVILRTWLLILAGFFALSYLVYAAIVYLH